MSCLRLALDSGCLWFPTQAYTSEEDMDLAISTTGFVLIVARLININPLSQSWRFKEGMSSSYSQ